MDKLLERGVLAKRHMHTGAIAGTTVGVVIVAALLAFCLYPVIVHRLKRRRHVDRPPLDTEAGVVPGSHDLPSDDAGTATHRLSSSDSLKQKGEAPRGDLVGTQSKELEWGERSGSLEYDGAYDGPNDPRSTYHTPAPGELPPNGRNQSPKIAQFPEYDGEYMPESIEDHQPGVLTGTSADYYRQSIPSEAFGMVTKPEQPVQRVDSGDSRSHSRGNSLRHNVRQLFRRSSDREQTMDSFASASTGEGRSPPGDMQHDRGVPLQPVFTNKAAIDSPTELSPMSSRAQTTLGPAAPAPAPAPAMSSTSVSPQPNSFNTGGFAPFATERASIRSSPPAAPPAPGTVNPMDIMAPSTESEMWYRTEHQLQASHDERPAAPPSPEQPETYLPPIPSSPLPNVPTQAQPVTMTGQPPSQNIIAAVDDDYPPNFDMFMNNIQQQGYLGPSPMGQHTRHPSYPSEQSTPLPGPSSTNPSSHNTPATQIDSPTPESLGSSDFRSSASPRTSIGVASPKTGPFRCEAPGCKQSFEQPHKLKHHQRYHDKDHKCLYPGCGKGFGTKTHLDRHINDRHEKKKKFHCAVQGCEYSRSGGRAFPRKDNWKRHMTRIHRMDQNNLPDPIEIDQEMTGT